MNHKGCPRFLKKNNVRHCQPKFSKREKIHCDIQINTQYSAPATNMLGSCQTFSTRNDGLDHYPILRLHAQNILGAKGLNWELTLPRIVFGGKWTNSNLLLLEGRYTRIFNIADRIPVPWHSRGYPILADFRNCLFLVHMNNAALNFVLSASASFREPFCEHLQCYLIWSFSSQHRWKFFCSIADDNLMSLQMIMIATECDESRFVA